MSTNTPTPEELEQMTDDAVSQATTGTTTADLERISDGTGNWLTEKLAEGYAQMTRWSATYALEVPTPHLSLSEGGAGAVAQMLLYVAVAVGLLSLSWYAARLAMASARGDTAVGGNLASFIIRLVFMLTLFFPLVSLLTTIADEFSTWILNDAMNGGLGDNLVEAMTITGPVGVVVMACVYGVMLLCSFVVLVFLFIKAPILILLTGVLIFVACTASGRPGVKTFWTILGWVLAFIMIEPAIAIVYASAFQMMGDQPIMEGGGPEFIYGFVLMLIAAISPFAIIGLMHAGFAALGGAGGMSSVMGGASAAARYTATRFDSKTGKSSPAGGSGPVAPGKAASSTSTNTTRAGAPGAAGGRGNSGTQGGAGTRGTQGAAGTSKAATATHTGPKAAQAAGAARTAGTAAAGGPVAGSAILAAKAGKKAAVGAKSTTDRAVKG